MAMMKRNKLMKQNSENYMFPINAVLNMSDGGFLEFKKDSGIYITDLQKTRKVYSKYPQILTNFSGPAVFSMILDIRKLKREAMKNEDVKYLIVNMTTDNQIDLSLD